LWAAKEVDLSPVLHFIRARQIAELSPADAAALGINEGDRVEVAGPAGLAGNGASGAATVAGGQGSRVRANVKLRASVPAGSVFLAEGTAEDNSNVLTHGLVEIHRIGAGSLEPSAVAAQIQPAVEGLSEAPASAPLPIPPREVT